MRLQRPASARSCVTRTNVLPDAAIEIEQEVGDALPGCRIQIARRLIREQDGRMRHEGARDRHALLLAARQLLRIVGEARRQADLRQRARPPPAAHRGAARSSSGSMTFSTRGERGNQMKRLKHEAHVLRREWRRGHPRRAAVISTPAIEHAAGARRIESREQRQQRGFAGAGSADDGQGLAGSHTEAHIGENGELALRARDGFGYILASRTI